MVSFPPITSIRDIEDIEKTPLKDRLDIKNAREVFERSCEQYGSKIALKYLFFGRSDEQPVTLAIKNYSIRFVRQLTYLIIWV